MAYSRSTPRVLPGYSSTQEHTHQQVANARDVAGDRPDDVARVDQQLERPRELRVPREYPYSTPRVPREYPASTLRVPCEYPAISSLNAPANCRQREYPTKYPASTLRVPRSFP